MIDELQSLRVQQLSAFPEELKTYAQWVVCIIDKQNPAHKIPLWAPSVFEPLRAASSTDRATWMTFERARDIVANNPSVVAGFVLTADDPFCCIDLDVKDALNLPDKPELWTTPEQMQEYWQLALQFDSYAETSPSGKGLHIWCKANIGAGVKVGGVEIYSQERFMTVTGTVILNKAVDDRQAISELLRDSLIGKRKTSATAVLEEVEETYTDRALWELASTAANADKFLQLFEGQWQELGYPSQSEADLSLMSMLCFYSESNAQCRRVFRYSGLGKREKATKDDRYLNMTIRICRSRLEEERKSDQWASMVALAFQNNQPRPEPLGETVHETPATARHGLTNFELSDGSTLESVQEEVQQVAQIQYEAIEVEPECVVPTSLKWPPGLMGIIAQFIYNNSKMPVREISVVAALAFASGLFGKSHNISKSGLNTYLILLARSGVGKEGMQTGLSLLLRELREGVTGLETMVNFSEFVSGPALLKAVAQTPCFVNVVSEFGRKLQRFSGDNPDSPAQSLRTAMTQLYQKSGAGMIVGGLGYSGKDQSVMATNAVAYSFLGESTPGTFYEALSAAMMEDGFLSRFTCIEYNGDRPYGRDMSVYHPLDIRAREYLQGAASASMSANLRSVVTDVEISPEARVLLRNFELVCHNKINSNKDEGKRQTWNRAHLKALKFSALLATMNNYIAPVVSKEDAEWAIELIYLDISVFERKYLSGDIGDTDGSRIAKLCLTIKELMHERREFGGNTSIWTEQMRRDGVVSKAILSRKLMSAPAFVKHKQGATNAINNTIRSLQEDGFLQEAPRELLVKKYGFTGKAWRVLSLPV